jgi:hypothetical protein
MKIQKSNNLIYLYYYKFFFLKNDLQYDFINKIAIFKILSTTINL